MVDEEPIVDAGSGELIEEVPVVKSALEWSESRTKLLKALMKAQSEMSGAKKTADNPFFRSRYADLGSVVEASREALTKNGIIVMQGQAVSGYPIVRLYDKDSKEWSEAVRARLSCTTELIHVDSDEWVRMTLVMDCRDTGPQAIGSGMTYGRRYPYMSLVGIVPEDDDGNAAQGQPARPAQGQRRTQTAAGGGTKKEVPPEVKKSRMKLGKEILARVEGNEKLAKVLLQDITSFQKGGDKPFPGYTSVSGIKSIGMVKAAWQRLRGHEQYGDEVFGLDNDELQQDRATGEGP